VLASCSSLFYPREKETKAAEKESVCHSYRFYELVPEELSVGKEDRRRYPEDFHPLWFNHLKRDSLWTETFQHFIVIFLLYLLDLPVRNLCDLCTGQSQGC